MFRRSFVLVLVFALSACSSKEPAPETQPVETEVSEEETTEAPTSPPETGTEPAAGAQSQTSGDSIMPGEEAIAARVEDARNRLSKSEPGKIVQASIETHGGLNQWYSNGPLAFQFDYRPLEGTVRNTYQVIDTWRSRARHQVMPEKKIEFGWTGEAAWIHPADVEYKNNPRFWSLTPYYFVAVPFVLADPGVILTDAGKQEYKGVTYDLIKVTFEDGTGDAPDDYYVVYFHPETRRVGGLRYVVSYPGFFPDGGHSPEKFMAYDGAIKVDGITFAKTYPTYRWDGEKHGQKVTEIMMSQVSFPDDVKPGYFAAPEGAKILEGY